MDDMVIIYWWYGEIWLNYGLYGDNNHEIYGLYGDDDDHKLKS